MSASAVPALPCTACPLLLRPHCSGSRGSFGRRRTACSSGSAGRRARRSVAAGTRPQRRPRRLGATASVAGREPAAHGSCGLRFRAAPPSVRWGRPRRRSAPAARPGQSASWSSGAGRQRRRRTPPRPASASAGRRRSVGRGASGYLSSLAVAEARGRRRSSSVFEVDPTNRNTALASALVEELARAGVEHACVAPGSRSAPLALALWNEPRSQSGATSTSAVPASSRSASPSARASRRWSSPPRAQRRANLHPAVAEAGGGPLPLIVITRIARRAARPRRRADDRPDQALRLGGALVLRAGRGTGRRRGPAPLPLGRRTSRGGGHCRSRRAQCT